MPGPEGASTLPRRLSRKRVAVFALAAMILAGGGSLAVLAAIDVYLHKRFERTAGFNIWGYRGPTIGRKQPAEYRVVMLGGSTAYGYGVTWQEAIPAALEQQMAGKAPAGTHVRVVNLGYNNEGAFSFKYTLSDYLWLDYDLAVLYEGYNDMMGDPNGPNLRVFRHDSPVFRLTGYLPIFPLVFKEKAAAMLNGGDVGAAYANTPTVFRPNVAARTTAEVLNAAAEVGQSLERQLGRAMDAQPRAIVGADSSGCIYPWQQYCRSVFEAVEVALRHDKQVLVVTQPYEVGETLRARHMEQQREMASMVEREFGSEPRVRHVNLGESVDLANLELAFDRMHLTPAGNRLVAEALLEPVLDMMALRHPAP